MLATKPPYPSLLFAVSRSVFPNLSLFSAAASADPARHPATSLDPQMQKLDRMATELISLSKSEARDFEILFRHKLDMKRFVPSIGVRGLGAVYGVAAADPSVASPDAPAAEAEVAAEKTAFDIRLEKIEANAKLKVTKEVRAFTDLGLKEAKELVEKAPVVLKKGVIKEEAERIAQKLKELGAVVVLE